MIRHDEKLDISKIRSELEQIIRDSFGGDDLPAIPDDVPILDLGAGSLALVEGMRRVYERFGVLVSIRHVIEGQITLGGLALYIEQELNTPQSSKKRGGTSVKEWKVEREVPMAASQQHIGFLSRYSSEAGAAYNEALLLRLSGVLDGPALQAAIDEVGTRYEALRTALNPDTNALNVGAGDPLELTASPVAAEELAKRLAEIVARPFDPGKRLFRAELLRLSDSEHVLALVGHALVLEQQALFTVLDDIVELYNLFTHDKDAEAAPPVLQWADYLAMGETQEARQAQQAAEAYWMDVFSSGIPRLEFAADHPRPPVKKYSGSRRSLQLDPALDRQLTDWAAAQHVDKQTVLCAVFIAFLHRLSSLEYFVVGVESQPLYLDTGIQAVARTRNMLPIRTNYDPSGSFRHHVDVLAETLENSNRHRNLSLAELIQLLNLPRDQSRSALFTVAFRSWSQGAAPAFEKLQADFILPPSAGARYDVELIAVSTQAGTQLVCDYSTELFEPETISRWLDGMATMLAGGLQQPGASCGLLPIMGDQEREMLVDTWNRTERSVPSAPGVFGLIREQAMLHPGKTAVRFAGQSLSYAGLLKRAEEIAVALHAAGVGHADRIGILLERSIDLIPAMLATWRLGALYVPVDMAFPKSRLSYMLGDADVKAIIVNRELLALLDDEQRPKALCIEDVRSPTIALLDDHLVAAGGDSAYIIYTSGSTGNPKGVEIRHTALVNALLAVQAYTEFRPESSMLALTTISFDVSTNELFMPLIAGGSVEVGEDRLVADGLQLVERFESCKPTHIQLTPSTWKNVLTAGWEGDRQLCLLSCGEAIDRELAERLLAKCRVLWNFYGPTETTVYSSAYLVESAPGKAMRIGRAFPNTRLYILDAQHQPAPVGSIGELYIGGLGLAVGYWKRPELTAERFITDPFHPDGKMYRTGDLARFLPDGNIICLGRVDDQVKIHGVRVELGEVEMALRSLDGVRDAVVTSWTDPHGDTQLVGHVILEQKGLLTPSSLRLQLRERLPEVMIPPYILFSEAFPKTANGKIHRAGLPSPDAAPPKSNQKHIEALQTVTEQAVAKIWAGVLGIDVKHIGRNSDFIDLGGHSLLMTLLMVEVRKQYQVSFNLREFFAASTLGKFAALVDERIQQQAHNPAGSPAVTPSRTAEWARQRMAFLQREAQLPNYLTPARGMVYKPVAEIRNVFLTGATGFLGAYTISEILKTTRADLYCLVRPKRGENGKERIERQMRHYEVWGADQAWQSAWENRLHVVDGDVTLPRMGLANHIYEDLAERIDAIFHGAAHVNFIYPYEALRATNVLGVHEIIQFAFHLRIKPVHHLSTAAIWPMGAQYTYYEKDPIDHVGVLNLGYDEAKWVGEKCLIHAEQRGLPVARYRPGEVGGDSVTGHCVTDHFIIACFKGFLQFGAFPDLDIEVDVAPVDYVARSMVHLAFNRNSLGRAFHLTNPTRVRMKDAFSFLRALGYQFKELPFVELRDNLVGSRDFAGNALFAYQAALEEMNDISMQLPTYDTRETERELAGSGISCAPADAKLFGTYLRYLQDIGFIPQPNALLARP